MRGHLTRQGIAPEGVLVTNKDQWETGNQMAVSDEDYLETLEWLRDEVAAELEDESVEVPIDKQGAEIVFVINPREIKYAPLSLMAAIKIFHVAKADWTMPSGDGWDNSNMAMYSGDFEVMGRVERLHWDRALSLKVKKIVMGECGHAFRGAVYDGPKWLGWSKPPIPMVHAVEYYYDLLKSGRIKIAKKIEEPVTIHVQIVGISAVLGLGAVEHEVAVRVRRDNA